MTGYGRGECSEKGCKATVELSSVNRKQTEISINLARDLEVLEAQIREEINQRISRGRLTVRISVSAASNTRPQNRVNVPLAKSYAREFSKLAKTLKLKEGVTLDLLLRAPGVIQTSEAMGDAESLWPAIQKALRTALDAMIKMREREGAHLARDLRGRIDAIRQAARRVVARAPGVAKQYEEQLRERIKNAGFEAPGLEDERLMKEVIYFADRSDISEELTRLQSHFSQFEDCLKAKEPVGRTLDFLSQEMNREINTIGSKANDSLISREVVVLKAELEKFREQAQNVE